MLSAVQLYLLRKVAKRKLSATGANELGGKHEVTIGSGEKVQRDNIFATEAVAAATFHTLTNSGAGQPSRCLRSALLFPR